MNRRAFLFLAFSVSVIVPQAAHAQDVIFLARHADRASSDPDSLLSKAGEARARCLGNVLKDANIKTIFPTEFKRTQQTAAPTAAEFHIEPKIVPRANTADLVKQLQDSKSYPVLIVGHAETLPPIVQQLGAGTIAQLGPLEYDKMIVIPVGQGQAESAVVLHYCSQTTDAAPIDRTMH